MSVLPVGFTQGHQPIAFQRHDEVLLPRLLEVFHVFRGGEPDVGQYPREFQPVLDAGIHHRPHLLILGDLATPLFLTGLDVAIMDRLAHQLEISPAVTHTNRLGLTRVRPSQGGKRPFHLPCPPSLHKLDCRRPPHARFHSLATVSTANRLDVRARLARSPCCTARYCSSTYLSTGQKFQSPQEILKFGVDPTVVP